MSEAQAVATPQTPAIDLTALTPVLATVPRRVDQLIPLLRNIQEIYGYVPQPTLDVVARHLHVSRAKVMGVATFYGNFSLIPQGRHKVCACRGTACHVRGGKKVLDTIRGELGVEPGETTPDMRFTLQTVACMGACALSPVMTVDGTYYGKLDARKAVRVLKHYGQESQS
jgi:NADH-quinone oxidoreductase subunit E